MPAIAAMVVVMTCKTILGSTQDACDYAQPKTWVYVDSQDLSDCADMAQDKNEFYEYLRSKNMTTVYQTARCEVVRMDADSSSDYALPAKPAKVRYNVGLQSTREVQDSWIF